MKQLLLICAVVALVGCGEREYTNTRDLNPNNPPPSQVAKPVADTNATQPVRTLTAEEKKVVGEYEFGGSTTKSVLLQNGACEVYVNGKKEEAKLKWSISNEEIHVNDSRFSGNFVYRLNKDKSITYIAKIIEGKRKAIPKDEQLTYKKIK